MKNTILIFLLTFSKIVSATDFYVSATGNDGSDGRSISTAWKTITKVNTTFPVFKSGDKILFNRGDTFYGTLKIAKSGSAGSPITIGAYGTGADPILTGFTIITGWTNAGGGIYSKVLSCESPPNIVVVNSVNTPMGRYPDSGWLSIDSHSTNISITDAALSSSPDWDGAEVVIRKKHWIMDRNLITNHTGSSISYTSASSNNAIDGYGYFIQKDLATLTTFGEWFYDAADTKFYMFFGAIDPNSRSVRVSTKDVVISNTNYPHYNYIILENLNLQGANKKIVDLISTSNFTIQNCVLQYSGSSGVYGGANGGSNSNNFTIKNSTISDCNNNAVEIGKEFQNALISNNTISNIGTIRGMGGSADGVNQIGIGISGAYGTIVEYNTINNIGYIPVVANGSNAKIRYNFIQNFCNVKDDGGGIYTTTALYTGREITNNIVLYGKGAPDGTTESYGGAHGIYLDDRSTDIMVSGNTCAFNALSGIYVHNTTNTTVQNNTSFDNEFQVSFVHDQHATDYPLRNLTVKENINFSKKPTQLTARINSRTADFAQFGSFDNNYYARPVDNAKPIFIAINWQGTTKALSDWQNYAIDLNSKISPVLLSDTSHIDFYFNQTTSDKVITLNVPMIDVKGIKHVNSIRLLPFTSAVLMVDPNPAAPTLPVFTGATIENASPTVLGMTYSISLANIVPPASAFNVMVNSVPRVVNSVSISGTRVLLTLASPVVNGNVVTVAYTAPATNQLQTSAGYKAVNLSTLSVINNVNSDSRPVYVSAVIENDSPNILEMTYNLSLANIVPPASAFKVTVNSVARTVNSVAISGTKVLLTLASPVIDGDVVTVAYTRPAFNLLQSLSNWASYNLTAQPVNNNVSAEPRPLYVGAVIENDSPNILEMTYNLSLANIVPPASAFRVTVNSVARTVNSVVISGTEVLLTLASPVVSGNIVTVAYTRPASNLLQSLAYWASENLTARSVNNNVSAEPRPVYVSAVIESTSPNILEMTYNLSLANIVPPASAFKVMVNSVARTINSVAISGTKVLLTLASPVVNGNAVTVAYTRPASNLLQSFAYWASINLTAQSVTNNVISTYKSFKTETNEEYTSLISPDSKIENSSPTENILIYPNPVIGFINIKMMEPVLKPLVIIFYDLSGKICLENHLESGTSYQQIPISLSSGTYYAKIMEGISTIFTQKIIVIK